MRFGWSIVVCLFLDAHTCCTINAFLYNHVNKETGLSQAPSSFASRLTTSWCHHVQRSGGLWLPMQPAQWPYGEPRRLHLFSCTSTVTVSSFIKAQPKFLVLQVRPLRVHLSNFTALPEFHFEARVAFALLFMQVDSRTSANGP